ncbi:MULTISPECIES: hypothetical protein [Mesorhizobium]|uniref:hypothetical protein n=1 Tax=Mesorhizobium TaxID=68287 RepID=UPI0007FBCD5A|nr:MULTISPECIES: hypothetical protein [Mesorhizobium]MUT27350.1 hypothetical protein [Mesorhizobium japonicum]OBQ82364.1 hypothetical protein A9K71_26350 [Mesorhizobium sp. WSM3873]
MAFFATAAAAKADVDAEQCRRQMADILRTGVDCSLAFDADPALTAQLKAQTGGAISGLACRMPLAFAKQRIYGEFITDGAIKLPPLDVRCTLSGAGPPLEVTTSFQPSCTRVGGGAWECEPRMSATTGLGVLGRILEAAVNSSAELKRQMGEALSQLNQR